MSTNVSLLSNILPEKEFDLSLNVSKDLINKLKNNLPKNKVLSFITNPILETIDTDGQLSSGTSPFKEPGAIPVVTPKTTSIELDKFISLQKWEGVVIGIKKDSFLARLQDLTQKGPEEEAEFPIEEVSAEDRKLIEPGAIFYWNIGYLDSRTGQRKRESIIRFRRLPAWRKEEIKASQLEAERVRETIGWK